MRRATAAVLPLTLGTLAMGALALAGCSSAAATHHRPRHRNGHRNP
jgi:hypothetical protein